MLHEEMTQISVNLKNYSNVIIIIIIIIIIHRTQAKRYKSVK